jgi:hypothetical protein
MGVPSRSTSQFFRPSRNSVTHREEFQASAVDSTVQLVPSEEEGIGAVTTEGTSSHTVVDSSAFLDDPQVLGMAINLAASFGGPLVEYFLQTTMLLEKVSKSVTE